MPPQGRDDASKLKLFLLPTPMHLNSYFCCCCSNRVLELLLWNLDFHKGSLVYGWLSERVFSRVSQIMTERGWSQFMGHCTVHSQDQGLYAYYPTHVWARRLLDLLVYGAGSHNCHKGTSVYGWKSNCCCLEWNINEGCLTQPYCWFHSTHFALKNQLFTLGYSLDEAVM